MSDERYLLPSARKLTDAVVAEADSRAIHLQRRFSDALFVDTDSPEDRVWHLRESILPKGDLRRVGVLHEGPAGPLILVRP
jgi:hypothetical protein